MPQSLPGELNTLISTYGGISELYNFMIINKHYYNTLVLYFLKQIESKISFIKKNFHPFIIETMNGLFTMTMLPIIVFDKSFHNYKGLCSNRYDYQSITKFQKIKTSSVKYPIMIGIDTDGLGYITFRLKNQQGVTYIETLYQMYKPCDEAGTHDKAISLWKWETNQEDSRLTLSNNTFGYGNIYCNVKDKWAPKKYPPTMKQQLKYKKFPYNYYNIKCHDDNLKKNIKLLMENVGYIIKTIKTKDDYKYLEWQYNKRYIENKEYIECV